MEKPKYNLTTGQASYIFNLRCRHDYSWRAVCVAFTDKYPEIESPCENQKVGMDLCNSAQLIFKTTDERWN